MKRIWVAISLIIISLSIATLEYTLVKKSCDNFSKYLDEAEDYYSNNELSKAHATIKEAQNLWDKTSKLLNSTLDHSETEDICENLYQLVDVIEKEDFSQFPSLCNKTKRQLLSMKESELPSFDNIM